MLAALQHGPVIVRYVPCRLAEAFRLAGWVCTIEGVQHRPQWPWSKEYRAQVQAHMRAVGQGDPDMADYRYVEWPAKERDITLEQARALVEAGMA